ncbi:MAG: hypothetical protein JNM52_09645 [Betaproteobacteria bacterium]|nr:hypothetical protein [Betaproteobacteria bacterium]
MTFLDRYRPLTGITLLLLGGIASQARAETAAEAPANTFATKISVYSEYEYRGITQTSENPALQLNLDYTHSSGFYLGFFASNIQWLKDTAKAAGASTNAQVELDFFGGYRRELVKDLTLDVGYLRYEYPQSGIFNPKPNTNELYAGLTYGPVNVKASYSTGNTFGVANSRGSTFLELNASKTFFEKWTVNAQIARQTFKRNGALSYNVYKLGGTYDFGDGWNAGAYYKTTSAEEASYTILNKDWSKGRLVGFVSKAF